RSYGDWSSDVCSSDLPDSPPAGVERSPISREKGAAALHQVAPRHHALWSHSAQEDDLLEVGSGGADREELLQECLILDEGDGGRSEERRVGKGCRSGR